MGALVAHADLAGQAGYRVYHRDVLNAPPTPSSPTVRRVMQGNRGKDTAPELAIRAALHARGLRFFKHRRPLPGLSCEADIVFPTTRIAVFVDGCFWHGCPEHGRRPATNREYWTTKIERNVARDRRNDQALRSEGWTVIRVWEHETVAIAADRIAEVLGTLAPLRLR